MDLDRACLPVPDSQHTIAHISLAARSRCAVYDKMMPHEGASEYLSQKTTRHVSLSSAEILQKYSMAPKERLGPSPQAPEKGRVPPRHDLHLPSAPLPNPRCAPTQRRASKQASKHLEFAAASSATALTSSCDTVGRILAGHLEAREYGAHDSMGLKGDGPGCHALTVRGPGEREAEGESGDVPIGDDKVARGAANIQEWKAGQSRSPHAGNRGLDIGAIFLWPCSLPRRRFGTVRLAMWHYCGV